MAAGSGWGGGHAQGTTPWRRDGLEAEPSELEGDAEGMAEALAGLRGRGKPAIYRCMSRVAGGLFLLGDGEKEEFVKMMRAYEAFGQVRVLDSWWTGWWWGARGS